MDQKALDAWLGKLVQLFSSGQLIEARALGQQLSKLSPDHPQLLNLLGAIHGRLGEFAQAESCYRTLLDFEPKSHENHYHLGMALIMQGRLQEAVAIFTQMLQLQPGFSQGHMQMGCLMRDLGHHDAAIRYFEQALSLNPALVDAAVFLANLLVFRGQFAPALRWLDHALQLRSDHQEALAAKSLLLEKRGEPAVAWACIQSVLSAPVASPGLAIVYAKLAPRHEQSASAQALLKRVLSRSDLAPSQRQELHFAVADLYDAAGEYDVAFEHYHAANALSRCPYDVAMLRDKAERVMSFFGQVEVPSVAVRTREGTSPIFIVGMPRSGTSLIEQILAGHPEVAAAGELEALVKIERDMPGWLGRAESYPDCLREAAEVELEPVAWHYRELIAGLAQGRRYLTDKLPGNYERLGLIAKLFPDARIVHMYRDARDTCLSCYFQNFGNTHAYSTNLTALGEVYKLYEEMMECWREILPIGILDIRYESLVDYPEKTVQKLLDFCDLPWSAKCLEFHKSDRYINTASYAQVRQPIYHRSVGRWKCYEPHLGELIAALS